MYPYLNWNLSVQSLLESALIFVPHIVTPLVCFTGALKHSYVEQKEKRKAIRQLHSAVRKDDFSLVKQLMKLDLDVNFHYNDTTALQIAVTEGYEETCRLLINNGADVDKVNEKNDSLVNMATARGFSDIVQLLVSHGAELNVSNSNGSTPLSTSSEKGYPNIAQILIDGGAFIDKPNIKQQTPLLVSCKQGHQSVAKVLVEAGCDLNWQDYDRRSPLIAAAEEGHAKIVRLLVDASKCFNSDNIGILNLIKASVVLSSET